MNYRQKYLCACLLGIAALVGGASPAFAAGVPSLGTASNFAVLSAAPGGGGAVTCTDSIINGNVGSSGGLAAVVQTSCTITGAIIAPVSAQVVNDFNTAYATLADPVKTPCDHTISGAAFSGDLALPGALTIDGLPNTGPLGPGVYCFNAAATFTSATLTLAGSSTDIWIFKIGTLDPTGYLTGTSFSVVMANGAVACNNVYWSVAAATTMTDSQFVGTILSGAAITLTRGTNFNGDALAKAAVTVTNNAVATGCGIAATPLTLKHCNQGVGNGPEFCDPGNSNQGNPFRTNDELGGLPGSPGRQGGNK